MERMVSYANSPGVTRLAGAALLQSLFMPPSAALNLSRQRQAPEALLPDEKTHPKSDVSLSAKLRRSPSTKMTTIPTTTTTATTITEKTSFGVSNSIYLAALRQCNA